jgi:hypothetical protein
MEVLACYNPLKQIRFVAAYKANNGSKLVETENKWTVNIVPQYMDLTKGIWHVSLDSYVYKCNSPLKIDTIFEISTSLCTSFESIQGTNLNQSVFTRLGSIHAFSPANLCNYGPFEKKWFLVEPADSQFQLFITQNKMSVINVPSVEVEFDISFLFQRIK